MIVTDLQGNTEMVTDYKNLERKQRVNGNRSLSFILYETDNNQHSYDLVDYESVIEYDNVNYRVKNIEKKTLGNRTVKAVKARHTYFDLINHRQYGVLSGDLTIQECLDFALQGTNYTYSVPEAFNSVYFEEFGKGETVVKLIETVLNEFGVEFDINGTQLTFKTEIGQDTDYQIRYKQNLKTLKEKGNTENLSTYIRGYGKDGIEAEYTSSMSSVYGILHAKPLRDDSITTVSELETALEEAIPDEPHVNFEIDFVELKKAGYEGEAIDLGDRIYVIYEELGYDLTARCLEITDYPEDPKSSKVVLANFKDNIIDAMADFKNTETRLDSILTKDDKVRHNVLDEGVKRATTAIQNTETQLEYDENYGIIARDPNNDQNLVSFNSAGLGISNDGGQTFQQALTYEGLVASIAWVGKIKANNIDVTGMITAINGEGSTTIDGGKIDAETLTVLAANIDGLLTANQIDATNLHVDSANIDGTLSASQIDTTGLKAEELDVTKGSTSYIQVDILPNPTGTDYIPVMTIRDGDMTYIFQDGQVFNIQSDYDIDLLAKNGRVNVKSALYATGNIQTDGTIYIGGTEVATKNDTLTAVFG